MFRQDDDYHDRYIAFCYKKLPIRMNVAALTVYREDCVSILLDGDGFCKNTAADNLKKAARLSG